MSRVVTGLGVLRCHLGGRSRDARILGDPEPGQREVTLQPTESGVSSLDATF